MEKNVLARMRTGALLAIMGLAGCGGGGSGDDRQEILESACRNGNTSACSQLTSKPSTTTPSTTASSPPKTQDGTSSAQPGVRLNTTELTIGDCTTNIPFIFSGGSAPYTVLSTDNLNIPVTSVQALGANYFFLASVGPLLTPEQAVKDTPDPYPPAYLTVLDSQGRASAVKLNFPVIHLTCPDNPLLQARPSTASAHVTEILSFQVEGGSGTFSAASSNDRIATVVAQNATSINVQAVAAGTALITITSGDGQKVNISFTVL